MMGDMPFSFELLGGCSIVIGAIGIYGGGSSAAWCRLRSVVARGGVPLAPLPSPRRNGKRQGGQGVTARLISSPTKLGSLTA